MSRNRRLTRRATLTLLASGAAVGVGPGPGRADDPGDDSTEPDGPVRTTVGYRRPSGARAARDAAASVVHEFAFDAVAVRLDPDCAAALRDREDVRYVEPDAVYRIADQTLPWGVDRVDADVAHRAGDVGAGARVAVLDTGIDATHPDLAPNLGEGVAFSGGARHDNWQDDNGHGTHCAGIVGAVDDEDGVVGVAPEATLHAVKVMAAPGAGLSSDVARGIEWAADRGVDVASISLGGDHRRSVADACAYAADCGVTLVASAGNDGPCTDCVHYPAAYPEVIAVTATTSEDRFWSGSSQGPAVDLAAPGEAVHSTDLGGYGTRTGTSMACPHVSGAAAQLAARGHSRSEIRERLRGSAEDVGISERRSGNGLLDVEAALAYEPGDDCASGRSAGSDPTETATHGRAADGSGGACGDAGSGTRSGTDASTTPRSTATAGRRTPDAVRSSRAPGGAPTPTSATPTDAGPSSRATPEVEPGRLGELVGGIARRVGGAIEAAIRGVVDAVARRLP